MSIRPLILKDGVITPPRSPTDVSSLLNSLGLNNVNNTSDINKPISIATQTALDLKANLLSPNFGGVPTVPTPTAGTNTTQAANCAFVSTAISNLVSFSPAALDTLNELAAALGNDANFSTTITNSLANKVDLTTNQSINGIKTFSEGLLLPSTSGTSIGTIWRNIDNLEYKDSSNVTKIILNSGGNLSNLSSPQTALNNLVGTQTPNRVLRSNGTNIVLSQVALPTDVTGILPISLGGTGSSTQNFVDLTTAQNVTGLKSFSPELRILNTTYPKIVFNGTSYGTDLKKFQMFVTPTGDFFFAPLNDAENISNGAFIIKNNGNVNFPSNTQSTSTTTGGVTYAGGVGIVGNVNIGGFSSLGDNVAFKVKRFTGTTDSVGTANFAHGLTSSKIIGVQILVGGFAPVYLTSNFGGSAEYNYFFTGGTFYIVAGANKNSIISVGYTVLITYIE